MSHPCVQLSNQFALPPTALQRDPVTSQGGDRIPCEEFSGVCLEGQGGWNTGWRNDGQFWRGELVYESSVDDALQAIATLLAEDDT